MTDEGHAPDAASARRSRALRSGILGSLGVRAIAVVAPLLLIPVTLDYLGPALFGLWAALTAVTAVTTFSDLGLGNGLLTLLPQALAAGDVSRARALVSSAYALLGSIAIGLLLVLGATYPFLPWEALFDPEVSLDPSGVRLVVAVALALTAIGAPLGLSIRLYYATQRGHLAALWTSATILAPVVPVLAAVHVGASPFVVVVLLVASGPVVQLVATMVLFTRLSPELRPVAGAVSRDHTRRLFRLGNLFLVLSVALMLATSLDNLVLAHSVGLAAVTAFAIPAKVFAQLSQALTLVNLPLWAAHGDALARGDHQWVRRTTRRMVLASGGAALASSVVVVVAGPTLLRWWLGHPVPLPRGMLVGLAAVAVVTAALSPLFMVLNATSVVIPQIVGWGAFAVVTLPGKYLATSAWGYEVMPWVALAGLVLLVAPPCVAAARRVLHPIEPVLRASEAR